jgi:hypothetical protein
MSDPETIDIARDFSPYPGGRVMADGPFNGQEFLEKLLAPKARRALATGSHLRIVLDGVLGLPVSFLDEAFGGLIRKRILTRAQADAIIEIVASTPRVQIYPDMIRNYIRHET